MGDGRTYEHVIALRIVDSRGRHDRRLGTSAVMTLLERISSSIINEVKGVNRCGV